MSRARGLEMKRQVKLFFIMILITISVTGCWDRLELEEQAYVVVIGMDKGVGNTLNITYQIANPQGGGGSTIGKSEKEPADEIITVNVPGIISGRDLLSSTVTRRPTFHHVDTLIVGSELAKEDDFFYFLEAALRDRQLRREIFFIVSKETAEDFIRNNSPKLETRPHKYYQFMKNRWEETGLVGVSTIHRFLQRTEGGEGLYLSIYAANPKNEKENKNKKEDQKDEGKEKGNKSGEEDENIKMI